jgi:hypothetical protein
MKPCFHSPYIFMVYSCIFTFVFVVKVLGFFKGISSQSYALGGISFPGDMGMLKPKLYTR